MTIKQLIDRLKNLPPNAGAVIDVNGVKMYVGEIHCEDGRKDSDYQDVVIMSHGEYYDG